MTNLGVGGAGREVAGAARQAANSPWIDRLARVGLAARGLIYVLVALLAIQIAFGGGSGGKQASQQGAFQQLAQNGFGKVVLWFVVLGFLGYAAWQASEAVWGHYREQGNKRTARRVESAAKAVIYVVLAVAAFRTVTGGSSGQGGQALTARLLAAPGGQLLVGLAGLVIVGVAAALAWRGWNTEFEEQLELHRMGPGMRAAAIRLGRAGYIARGVVFAIVGLLVVAAAVTFDPKKARGLDVALRELASQPYGPYLLLVVALGLICFGAYSFIESRYRRL